MRSYPQFPKAIPHPNDRSLRDAHPSATKDRNPPCDLHVLSMPPAFALSQDQTLRFFTTCATAPHHTGGQPRHTSSEQKARNPTRQTQAIQTNHAYEYAGRHKTTQATVQPNHMRPKPRATQHKTTRPSNHTPPAHAPKRTTGSKDAANISLPNTDETVNERGPAHQRAEPTKQGGAPDHTGRAHLTWPT